MGIGSPPASTQIGRTDVRPGIASPSSFPDDGGRMTAGTSAVAGDGVSPRAAAATADGSAPLLQLERPD